jgi:hypothetical protein
MIMETLKTILNELITKLFGCRHNHRTTPRLDKATDFYYEVCLDCGFEIPYVNEILAPTWATKHPQNLL